MRKKLLCTYVGLIDAVQWSVQMPLTTMHRLECSDVGGVRGVGLDWNCKRQDSGAGTHAPEWEP